MTKGPVVSTLVALAVVALAFALNPSPEQHRAKIRQVISERSLVAKAFGIGALTAFTSNYHQLGVASYTTVNDRTVSVGAFGMVFVREPSQDK